MGNETGFLLQGCVRFFFCRFYVSSDTGMFKFWKSWTMCFICMASPNCGKYIVATLSYKSCILSKANKVKLPNQKRCFRIRNGELMLGLMVFITKLLKWVFYTSLLFLSSSFSLSFLLFWNTRYNWPVRTHHSFPGWNDFCCQGNGEVGYKDSIVDWRGNHIKVSHANELLAFP